jgi:hypothetical protein
MLEEPPNRLLSEPLIQVLPESKVPVGTYESVEVPWVVVDGIAEGYNVGICLEYSDLVVVDADTTAVAQEATDRLSETFTVETGGNGFGVHYYYHCPEWGPTKKLGDGDSSVRSDGAMAVLPPSKHPDGGKYRVTRDISPVEVDAAEIQALVDALTENSETDAQVGQAPHVQTDFDGFDELDELINHDGYRADIRSALADPEAMHNQRQFVAGFLHDKVGLSHGEIVRLIDRLNQWSNYDREITERQVRSVIESDGGGR